IPLVIAISTALAARSGILVKDRLALERMRTVDAVLFDKTGTLTTGRPQVSGVAATDGDPDGLLAVAGAVAADSEHPLARAAGGAAGRGRRAPARQAGGHAHRRRPPGRRGGRRRAGRRRGAGPRSCPRTRTARSPASRAAGCRWPWSVTASTTPRPWPGR